MATQPHLPRAQSWQSVDSQATTLVWEGSATALTDLDPHLLMQVLGGLDRRSLIRAATCSFDMFTRASVALSLPT